MSLLREYLQPAHGRKLMLESALGLIHARRGEMDLPAVFKLLDPHVPLAQLEAILSVLLCEAQQAREQARTRCSLLKARSAQLHAQLLEERSSRVVVTESSRCGACGKRIGTAAFCIDPTSAALLHVACRASSQRRSNS